MPNPKRTHTRAEQDVAARVLARDGRRCQLAYPGEWTVRGGGVRHCMGRADCVHHTKGVHTGMDMAYLVAACTPCNLRAGQPTTATDPPHRSMTTW